MNFLITSISSVNFINIHTEYFQATNISAYHSGSLIVHTDNNDSIKNGLSYSIFGPNITSTDQLESRLCFCSDQSAAESLINIYSFNYSSISNTSPTDETEHEFGYWLFNEYNYIPTSSCVLTDTEKMLTWVISDVVASVPVWYSFSDVRRKSRPDFIVSSDLFLASRLGFAMNSFSSVGGGQVISMDTSTGTIQFIGHFQADRPSRYKHSAVNSESRIDLYSQLLLSSAMESVSTALEVANSSIVFSEVDVLESSSQLLQCAINSLTVTAEGYDVQVIHGASTRSEIRKFDPPHTSNFVTAFLDSVLENEGQLQAPFHKIRRLADERWRMCTATADHFIAVTKTNPTPQNPALFFSFDDGLLRAVERKMEIYLQNLFCPLLHVKVVYPFAGIPYQNSLWRTDIPHSYLYQSMGILHRTNLCHVVESTSSQSTSHGSGISKCTNSNSNKGSHFCQLQSLPHDSSDIQQYSLLWHAARLHSTDSGHIVLLLVTSGYLDLLSNFICSVRSFQPTFRAFLIITSDDAVVQYAQSVGVGVYRMTNYSQSYSDNFADFGTMKYQELVLGRTEVTMKLLLMGYKPIIADIDAVWLSDPLRFLKQPQSADEGDYDVAVTDDNGEVCGCFVALSNSEPAKLFWMEVLRQHRELVKRGELSKFSDSEQKILTALIYEKEYRNEALFRLLPKSQFPSGYMYFNLQSGRSGVPPAVIHNNFLIGKEMKKERFKRYGLWFTAETEESSSVPGQCVVDNLQAWRKVFGNVSREVYIPSLNIILPVHNSVAVTDRVMVQVLREEPISEAVKQKEDLVLWVESDPPKYAQFTSAAIAQLRIENTKVIASVIANIYGTNIEVSADVGANREIFAADFGGNSAILKIAHERVQNISLKHQIRTPEQLDTVDEKLMRLRYSIKVLAFNRADSLTRLLNSLLTANYLGYPDISLEIFIDYAKNIEDAYAVNATVNVAEAFQWPHGSKRVTRRMKNYGLASQWYFAWAPEDENEVAFIFEDDVEVSPYFFTWASQVAEKYYESSLSNQREIHRHLLQAVRDHIKFNGSKRIHGTVESWSDLEAFAAKFAGYPILYGACLQKQNLDPSHYPKKLELHTGHRPFLYSLVGSWGPMMFPLFWQAFREWWSWSARRAADKGVLEPQTENIVVNYFYRSNTKIWTPWIVRFAYETGCKCLYANLPGDYSLVVNHREVGENYKTAHGMHAKMLSRDVLKAAEVESNRRLKYEVNNREQFFTALRWSLLHLPDYSVLSQWQFDHHLRRLGSYGMSAPYFGASLPMEMIAAVALVIQCAHDTHVPLSLEHWIVVSEILESHLLPDSIILHIAVTPLLALMGKIFWSHTILTSDSSQCACLENIPRMPGHLLKDQPFQCIATLPNNSYVDVAVLQLPDLVEATTDIFIADVISFLSSPPRYLLVFGPCSSAPTDLMVSLSGRNAASDIVRYVQLEAICHLGGSVGAVLFETSSAFHLRNSGENQRFSISRQTVQNLLLRSTIVRENRQPL